MVTIQFEPFTWEIFSSLFIFLFTAFVTFMWSRLTLHRRNSNSKSDDHDKLTALPDYADYEDVPRPPIEETHVLYDRQKLDTYAQHSSCLSPHCVRCNVYKQIYDLAVVKLKKYVENNELTVTERLRISLDDRPCKQPERGTFDQNPSVFCLQNLSPSKSWWDDSEYNEFTDALEAKYKLILQEFENICDNRMTDRGWIVNSTPDGEWSVFHLINQGKITENNSKHCPEVMQLVDQFPCVMKNNVFGNVSFSVMQPGTHITPHYGPTNIRIRCHLGLIIPSGCSLQVNETTKSWSAGKCLLFDDSYLHSAQHDGCDEDEARVVLIIDLWHPSVAVEEQKAVDAVFRPS